MAGRTSTRSTSAGKRKTAAQGRRAAKLVGASDQLRARGAAAALEDARRAGLLDGERTAHLSLRVPPALLEAAKRESGIASPTELGILALAMLAQPDPVAAFFNRTYGRLGKGHTLEY